MDQDIIEGQYKEVIGWLEAHKLKDALTLLATMAQSCGDYILQQELDGVQTSHNFMLQYMEQGIADPERATLYNELLVHSYTLADQIMICLMDESSYSLYHSTRKRLKRHPVQTSLPAILNTLESFNDSISLYELLQDKAKLLSDLKIHEEALKDMFMLTWTNSRWNATEKAIAYKYSSSTLITSNDLSLYVSAVTLSLMICFDIEKMFWLMDAFYHKDTQVKVRAIIGFAIAAWIHSKRITLFPSLEKRLNLMLEEMPHLGKDLNAINLQLTRSRGTERINKTMNEEIAPEVLKNIQKRQQDLLNEEEEELGMNPDWLFDLGAKLNDKMRKIGEFQQEGGDINMASFSRLKGFTFFNEIQNWLYPFEPMHSEVIKTFGDQKDYYSQLYMDFFYASTLCNSDCYSMLCVMQQQSTNKSIMDYIKSTKEQLDMMMKEANIDKTKHASISPNVICKFYIHDLYRFLKISPFKSDFKDIFKDGINLTSCPLFMPLLVNTSNLRSLADLFFKFEMYDEACSVYEKVDALGGADNDVYQRMGYCKANGSLDENDIKSAISYYEKALLISPDNKWTLKHLAASYRKQHLGDKELKCYQELVALEPDNLTYNFKLGQRLMKDKKFNEALSYFYKVDLIQDDNVKVWRGIAWCSFVIDKIEQAQKYCEKLIALKHPAANDWLNAGHVAWCRQDFKQALSYYRNAAKEAAHEPSTNIYELFKEDQELMEQKGIDTTDYLLVQDLL
ncbi:MAG: hypothetical protein K5856_03395 [Bacteroidaceae bacterium]|nr:hypothetical protein [Bacteroidaceae bacterium]